MQFRFSPLPCTTVKQKVLVHSDFSLTDEVLSLQPMFPPKPLDILPLEVDAQKVWTPLRKSGGIPYVKHEIQPKYGDEQADAGRDCRTRLARPNSQARTRTGQYSFSLFS